MSEMPHFTAAATPVAHEVHKRGLNLPTYFALTQADVREISQVVIELWASLRENAA